MRPPATYKEIQKWVVQQFGFTPETCWIAHCREVYNLLLLEAPNRQEGGPSETVSTREADCHQNRDAGAVAVIRPVRGREVRRRANSRRNLT